MHIELFIIEIIICPRVILIIKRIDKVKIWMKNLLSSIILIKKINIIGVFLGVKFINIIL